MNFIKSHIRLTGISLLLATLPISAMATTEAKKLWTNLNLMGNYGKIVYNIDSQLRFIYRDNSFQQFITHVGIGYKVASDWQLWLGQAFSADSQDAVAGSAEEYRIWQQIIWKKSLSFGALNSRTRFEERKSLFFPDWAYRLRQRLQLNKPLTSNLSLVLSDEIFFNINKASWIATETFDQNRAYLGLEQQLTATNYLGVGYMNQYLSTLEPQSNHVLWLTLRINLEQS